MLQVTLRSIADGVITTDKHRRITWLNPVAERLTGWSVDDAIGLPLSDVFTIVDDRTRQAAAIPITGTFSRGEIVGITNNSLLLSRHGGESGIEASAAPICNEASEKLGLVVVFHDVTEQRHLHGEMSHRATHDTLTGLINRAEFTTRLECMLHRVQTDESQSALLFIDLDQFKPVNDSCGHAAGDELLILMANMLTEGARAGDTVARLGGDEFAILLDHCPIENAQIIAQKFCDRLDAFRFTYQTHRFRIGASIGLVPFDRRWSSIAAAMQAADASCYAAKEAGRGRVHTWFECDRTILARQGETKWSTLLAQALDEDAFVLFAQHIQKLGPKPGRHAGNIRDGLHGEVLLRLPADDGSLFLPGAFLPAAERFHIMPRIDRWVLAKIVDWMTRAPSLAHIDMLCVNLSGQSVGDLAFHGWAIAMLATAGADICRRLCIEITETAAVTNFADARIFIEQLRAIGVRVALDDFGAGASSFGYLKTMPVDILKIDGQFVKNLMTDSLDESAIRCFVDVAATVGIKTIAEFVENTDVQNKLRAMGVDYGQGYLFHKPAPIDEVFANVVLIKSA
ncbi:MAG: EAL domain-containing protein [Pseudomonadota bacterium]|nr:EAL domain-containing protein [Pseudomonadota bacterium]